MSTKQEWKETGKDLGHAFKGLGKTIFRTAKTGVNKVSDWADSKDSDNKPAAVTDKAATTEQDTEE